VDSDELYALPEFIQDDHYPVDGDPSSFFHGISPPIFQPMDLDSDDVSLGGSSSVSGTSSEYNPPGSRLGKRCVRTPAQSTPSSTGRILRSSKRRVVTRDPPGHLGIIASDDAMLVSPSPGVKAIIPSVEYGKQIHAGIPSPLFHSPKSPPPLPVSKTDGRLLFSFPFPFLAALSEQDAMEAVDADLNHLLLVPVGSMVEPVSGDIDPMFTGASVPCNDDVALSSPPALTIPMLLKDLDTLGPGQWVNDSVVNFWMKWYVPLL
jgi:hypothetical protein